MKQVLLCLLSVCLLLVFAGCSARETGEHSSADLSPAIGQLRSDAVLLRCTANYEDLSFAKADFCDLTGEGTSYIVIGTLPQTGVLMLNGTAVISGQTVPVSSLDYLKYVPGTAADGEGEVSFTFTANATGWESRELTCVIELLEGENYAPVGSDTAEETFAGVTCYASLGVTDPNGDDVTYRIVKYPLHGSVRLENGNAVYTPEADYTGEDSVTYTVTDCYGKSGAEYTVTFSVVKNESGIYFSDLEGLPIHNAAIRLCADNVMTYRYENGKYYFSPEEEVSKIDCLVMMMCGMGQDEIVTAVTDTEASDDAALSAGKKGFLQTAIHTGCVYLENGKFSPDSAVTAADAAYMAIRILDLPSLSAKQEFSDLDATPAWACTALVSADSAGILEAENGVLGAGEVLTKADVAQLLENMRTY